MTKRIERFTVSDEELLIIQKVLDKNPWLPTKGYAAHRALSKRIRAEVEHRGLKPVVIPTQEIT
jgi:hypothetical protein